MLGLLVVSHSADAARGIAQIASEMAESERVKISGVGGDDEGGLGVSVVKIMDALSSMLLETESVLVIPDLGGSVLSAQGAVDMLAPEDAIKVKIIDAPVLEGTLLAAVEASCGSPLELAAESAIRARELRKIER